MHWKPYQDQENRAYSSILTSLFPEQTKTIPRILVWSVIFLVDLTVVVAGSSYLGLFSSGGGVLMLAILFVLFWLQGRLCKVVCQLFAKKKEKDHVSL